MPTCQFCVPWNLPLTQHAKLSAEGAVVGMTYQEWLWWRLHVSIHQRDNWAGELDEVSAKLRADRTYQMVPSV